MIINAIVLLVQEFYHFLQHQRAKVLSESMASYMIICHILYLFTVTSPNVDFETTIFGQLKKPCHPSGFSDLLSVLQKW